MTRDTRRPEKGSQPETSLDADFLAALWEDAPFARLPPDAPPELKDMVQTIENPKRVYAIHRASRRHNFQILVEIYILQLRYGCDSKACTTSTCFSCRKRLAGKAPIRRYNTTSARTLAVYLASQDNPETGLCPYLKPRKMPRPR
ncbi:ubiquitin-protein ligase E3A [Colletotrichum higginsianum]|nr:ubiquitin-protein ligase E3A [Colletotrichum higginsianum]